MALEKTGGDQVRIYLTGADSDGGTQSSADASLGKYRSSSEVWPQWRPLSLPRGITVDRISLGNGTGQGVLHAPTTGSLRWQAPSGSFGDAVTIANGQTRVLESILGGSPHAFLRVSRTTTDDLQGAHILQLGQYFGNVFGMSDLSNTERTNGESKVRCVALYNEGASAVTDFSAWCNPLSSSVTTDSAQLGASGAGTIGTTGSLADFRERGFAEVKASGGSVREIVMYTSRTETVLTVPALGRELLGTTASAGAADDTVQEVPGLRLAFEAPTGGAKGYASTADDENDLSEISGLSWSASTVEGSGPTYSSLAADSLVYLWLWLAFPAGGTGLYQYVNDARLSWYVL